MQSRFTITVQLVATVWLLSATATSAWSAFPIRLQSRLSLDEALLDRIERFRQQMPCGVDGGPPLAPYQLDELDLTQSVPGVLRTTGAIHNLTVRHLDEFIVDYLTFSLFRLRLEYSLTLPAMRASGHYNVNATLDILDGFEVWGNGPFEFNLHNINVNGFARLRLSLLGQLSVVELETLISIESVESRFANIMDSEEGTEFYNYLIEQLLPGMLANNQRELSDRISELLIPILNEELSGMTLADLIAAAGGSNDDDVPCVVTRD